MADNVVCLSPSAMIDAILAQGYPVVPIAPGTKYPGVYHPHLRSWRAMAEWQTYATTSLSRELIVRWSAWPCHSLGVPTGKVCGIDGDITHPALAAAVLSSAFRIFGRTPCIRIGNAPKFMLVYRAATPSAKRTSARYTVGDHQKQTVEVLGVGQQFVAFGTHPTTNRPYIWPERSILEVPVDDLPVVTTEQISEFLEEFEYLAEVFGGELVGAGAGGGEIGKDLIDQRGLIAEAMASLPEELAENYHDWVRVGMALKAALPEEAGLPLWEEFSARCEGKFDLGNAHDKWNSFHPTKIGAGTLYKLARDNGWSAEGVHTEAEDDFAAVGAFASIASEVGLAGENDALGTRWLTDYTGSDLPPRPWLLGHHLLRGQVTTLVAPGGVGKSTLALTWAAAIASGMNLSGATPHGTGSVWLINNEDDETELMRRFAAIRQHFAVDWDAVRGRIGIRGAGQKKFSVAERGSGGAVVAAKGLAGLIEYLQSHRVAAVIVDPLVSTHCASENDNGEMEAVMSIYRRIAAQANCAVCLVHHTSKPPGGSSEGFAGNANAGRGASAVVNAARISLTLFDMSEADAKRYGIGDAVRGRYVRLDDAKANLTLRSGAAQWYFRESVAIGNGEDVGVLKPVDLLDRSVQMGEDLLKLVVCIMQDSGRVEMPVEEALKVVREDPMYADQSRTTLRRGLLASLESPYQGAMSLLSYTRKEGGKVKDWLELQDTGLF